MLCTLFILFAVIQLQAQATNQENSLEKGTLSEQFEYLLDKGGPYNVRGRRFIGIRETYLTRFNKNLLDSIGANQKISVELKNIIAENTTEIDALKSKLSETTENLNKLTQEKDSMSFFGAMVSKGTYRAIVWSTILVLIFALVLFIYKFRKSNFLTVQAKTALTDLEEEYEQYRRRALEREQKISRELHDERNKNKKG